MGEAGGKGQPARAGRLAWCCWHQRLAAHTSHFDSPDLKADSTALHHYHPQHHRITAPPPGGGAAGRWQAAGCMSPHRSRPYAGPLRVHKSIEGRAREFPICSTPHLGIQLLPLKKFGNYLVIQYTSELACKALHIHPSSGQYKHVVDAPMTLYFADISITKL